MTGRDRGGPGVDADDVGVGKENVLDEDIVDVLVAVGAPVGQDDQLVVEVGCLPEGRQDHTGRRNARQHQPADPARPVNELAFHARIAELSENLLLRVSHGHS
jgi:hypothetical protein